jgi:hypothetical protein
MRVKRPTVLNIERDERLMSSKETADALDAACAALLDIIRCSESKSRYDRNDKYDQLHTEDCADGRDTLPSRVAPPFRGRRKRRGAENRHHVCDGIDYRSRPASISSRRGASCEPNSFAFSYQLRANEMSETCVPKTPIFSSMIGS